MCMNGLARLWSNGLLLSLVSLPGMPLSFAPGQTEARPAGPESSAPTAAQPAAERKREERREFQSQELMLAKSGTWIFKPGETPRILWRDVETVRRLGCSEPLRVRWFDAELNESPEPNAPGRWLAWIEGTAPNGTPLRRSRTFYALPKQLPSSFSPDLTVAFPNFPGPEAPVVLQEHEAEIVRLANDALVRAVLGSEQGAILVAGTHRGRAAGTPGKIHRIDDRAKRRLSSCTEAQAPGIAGQGTAIASAPTPGSAGPRAPRRFARPGRRGCPTPKPGSTLCAAPGPKIPASRL